MNQPIQGNRSPDEPLDEGEIRMLAAAHCENTIDAADFQRLQEILKSSQRAREIYSDYRQIHAWFSINAISQEQARSVLDDQTSCDLELTQACVVDAERYEAEQYDAAPTRSQTSHSRKLAIVVAIAAAVLAVVAPFALTRSNDNEKVATATVSGKGDNVRWFIGNRRIYERTAQVRAGEEVILFGGQLDLDFDNGAEVTVRGPTSITPISRMRVWLEQGQMRASVGPEAIGFSVETPSADVVDLGTQFGVRVGDDETTSVAVFSGEVDVKSTAFNASTQPRRLRIGEGLQLSPAGDVQALEAIVSHWFPSANETGRFAVPKASVISGVTDNLKTKAGRRCFYEIVPAGLREDALAYADRGYHQWNGADSRGIPNYLVGADYVKLFNNRKRQYDVEIYLSLAQAAGVFVFWDDRLPHPAWLTDNYVQTGDVIGLDEGPHIFENGSFLDRDEPGIGAGVSVDRELSIWMCLVNRPSKIQMGSNEELNWGEPMVMYGVAAVPLNRVPKKLRKLCETPTPEI